MPTDKERIDWLSKKYRGATHYLERKETGWWYEIKAPGIRWNKTIRQSIDLAIRDECRRGR